MFPYIFSFPGKLHINCAVSLQFNDDKIVV